MATYKSGSYVGEWGDLYYGIYKKHWFYGWVLERYWTFGKEWVLSGNKIDEDAKSRGKEEMEKVIERLVKAGHTVL